MPRKPIAAIDNLAQRASRRSTLTVPRRDLCVYLADFAAEFERLAKGHHNTQFLSYLLGLVLEEAVTQSRILAEAEAPPKAAAEPKTSSPFEDEYW
jgi:hypothetical protein